MKHKGRVVIPQEKLHELFGKSKRPGVHRTLRISPDNETIIMNEMVPSTNGNTQKAVVITYEVLTRKLGWSPLIQVDMVEFEEDKFHPQELKKLSILLSSSEPIPGLTCKVAEGLPIPRVELFKEED